VTDNDITGPCAANGVVAENINGLHAHRANGIRVHHRDTQSILDCGAEVAGFEDGVVTVFTGGNGSDKPQA
jgi:hypothetical protein